MVNRAKRKGTDAENYVVDYLKRTHWPYAERRALAGTNDKGDITGTPALAWEVKSAKTLCVPAWLRETEAERVNALADYGTLVIKPEGVGKERVASFYALMNRIRFDQLVDAVRPHQGSCFWWETTIRKSSLAEGSAMTRMTKPHVASWWWCYYPTFVLTDLSQMAALLNRAGYGSPAPEPE